MKYAHGYFETCVRIRIAVDISVFGDSAAEQFKSERTRCSILNRAVIYTRHFFRMWECNLCSLENIAGERTDVVRSSVREIKWGRVPKGNLMHLNALRGFGAPWKLVVKLKVVRVLLRQKREDYMKACHVYTRRLHNVLSGNFLYSLNGVGKIARMVS